MNEVAVKVHDVSSAPTPLRLRRYDAPYDGTLDCVSLTTLFDDVKRHWEPRLSLPALAGRDPDIGWDWRDDVLCPAFAHLRTGEPRGGTLLVLGSDRGCEQPETVARIIYDWETFHLPKRTVRRNSPPSRPLAAYVDTIAVAPWNRANAPPPPRVREIGKLLLFASILLSHENGKEGRIALHGAALAESWYREVLPRARFEYDRRELGDDVDPVDGKVDGPYIEVDGDVARAYCEIVASRVPGARDIASLVPANVGRTLLRVWDDA